MRVKVRGAGIDAFCVILTFTIYLPKPVSSLKHLLMRAALFECDGDKCGLSSSRILHIRYEEEGCMRCHVCICVRVVAEAVVALSQHIDGSALRSIYSALQRAYDVGNGEHDVGTVQVVIRYILRGRFALSSRFMTTDSTFASATITTDMPLGTTLPNLCNIMHDFSALYSAV